MLFGSFLGSFSFSSGRLVASSHITSARFMATWPLPSAVVLLDPFCKCFIPLGELEEWKWWWCKQKHPLNSVLLGSVDVPFICGLGTQLGESNPFLFLTFLSIKSIRKQPWVIWSSKIQNPYKLQRFLPNKAKNTTIFVFWIQKRHREGL